MQAQNYCLKMDGEKYVKGDHLIVTLGEGAPEGLLISPYAYANKVGNKQNFRLSHKGTGSVVDGSGKEVNDEGGKTIHLGGRSSNIFLIYPEGGIPNGSQAVITVTNEAKHNIAQYTIIFDETRKG